MMSRAGFPRMALAAWIGVAAMALATPSPAATESRKDCDLAASLAGHLPPPGHFAEISGSTFRDVMFPPEAVRRMGIHSAQGPRGVITSWNGAAFDDETYALIRSWRVAPHPRFRRMPVRPIYSKMQYLPAVDAFAMDVNPKEGMWLYRLPKDLRGG